MLVAYCLYQMRHRLQPPAAVVTEENFVETQDFEHLIKSSTWNLCTRPTLSFYTVPNNRRLRNCWAEKTAYCVSVTIFSGLRNPYTWPHFSLLKLILSKCNHPTKEYILCEIKFACISFLTSVRGVCICNANNNLNPCENPVQKLKCISIP
jgi:hypothetical protein